jgi:murein DD-endopeptidase MepM/ murein hydrolase activator NlpD
MKGLADFRTVKLFSFITAGLWLASCGGLQPPDQTANLPQNQNTNLAIVRENSPTPAPTVLHEPIPDETPLENPSGQNANTQPDQANDAENAIIVVKKLMIPVAGVKPEALSDTFKDSRDGGRVHDAIDIMAPQGTPVLAVADGEIARFFDSERGGITIYQYSHDKKLIYYYAHLQRRADNLQEKQFVKQGTVIGYVGDTGNSGAGNFHLHFAIWTIDDPKRYWEGTNINPYPLLR